MVFTIMLSKSWAACLSVSVLSVANPRPRTNARTRAVMTFINGGMLTQKYGASSSAEVMASSEDDCSIIDGKIAALVMYDSIPAITVEPYAMATVSRSIFSAPFPMSAIAVVTNPSMMSGMANPRNWLNIPLNVRNMRIVQSGEISPMPIPAIIAVIIFPNRPILIFFMWLRCV